MSQPTPQSWAATLLKQLGIHQTPGAVQALTGWARAEGGNWNNAARFNPLNTTQGAPGAASINSVGVKSYRDWQQGLDATVKTLRNGRYGGILDALQSGDPTSVANAIGRTPWGTAGGLVQRTIASTPKVAGVHAFGTGSATSGSGRAGGSSAAGSSSRSSTSTVGGVDNSAGRAAAIQAFLGDAKADPVVFAAQIKSLQDTPAKTVNSAAAKLSAEPASSGSVGSTPLSAIRGRANAINSQHLPYQWGGGHGSTKPGTPLDCSGAVSKVLGINPRVADQFKSWGTAGDGGNRGVTIYSSPTHVLMKINGHFFGTSASNPGGGAGWIPQSAISPDYLKSFTARHAAALS